jgi:hypothetical protein
LSENGYTVFGFNPYWVSTKFTDKLCPPTSVRDGMGSLPTKFKLYFNYPNPFNPTTTIKFDIPKSSLVRLEVYNVLGVLVKTLVDEQKEQGSYSVAWDGMDNSGTQISSGLYFYKLTTEKGCRTNKAILIK